MNQDQHFHKHLELLQGIISRMAANSSSSKNYCISLVAALLALALANPSVTEALLFVAFIPIVLFGFLDAYYLSLERHFKNEYQSVVFSWQSNSLERGDLFSIHSTSKGMWRLSGIFSAMGSYSIFTFYGTLLVLLVAIIRWVSL